MCIYRKEGCEWEGVLVELDKHLIVCKFAREGKKQCPLEPIGCLTKQFMDKDELRDHLINSEYDHLIILVRWVQGAQDTVGRTRNVNTSMALTRVEPDGEDTGYETMNIPGYEKLSVTYPVEKDGMSSSRSKNTRGMPQSLPEIPNIASSLEDTSGVLRMLEESKKEITKSIQHGMKEEMRSMEEEIASLRTQITKLEKQIRSKNAELEDRDFRLSLIENSNHDGSMIWKIPQFSQRKADAENGKYTLSLIHI